MGLDSLLKPFDDLLTLQKRYRFILGVREVDEPTYKVKDGFEKSRYNQKYWIESWGRGAWDPVVQKIFKRVEEERFTRLKMAKSSYALISKSLADASGVLARSHPDERSRWPNLGFLSWNPLTTPTHKKFEMKKLDVSNRAATSNLVKKVAMWFGASLVGIARLKRLWVYSHWSDGGKSFPPRNPQIRFTDEKGFEEYTTPTQLKDGTQIIPKEMKYVIATAAEEDYESLKTAPSDLHSAGIRMHGYHQTVRTVSSLAEFIRGLGFNAIPSVSDTTLKGPIAMDAGMGEDSRIGLLITPEYGPRVRLGTVITDMPMQADKPITFGVHEFCENCMRCAQECPVHAISFGPRTYGIEKNDVDAPTISTMPGPLRWVSNYERCSSFMGGGCGICRRVCPWNKAAGIFHTISKWLAVNGTPFTTRMLVKMDEIFGYGKRVKPEEWWTTAKPGPHT